MSTVTYVGATGVTGADAAESGPKPTALRAFTVNVYDVPFARPVTTHVVVDVVHVPPGDPVTTYSMIDDPPVDDGGSQSSDT
jgi:hypothetical protein